MKMVRVTGPDGSHAWINPERVAAVMPAQDKGVTVLGTCVVFMAANVPPMVVKESPEAFSASLEGKPLVQS